MSRTGRISRALGAIVACAAAMSLFATAAFAEEPPALTPEEEYGFIEGTVFAKAHPPIASRHLSFEETRIAVLAAPDVLQAGAHPDATTGFSFRSIPGKTWPLATKDIMVDAPPGFVGSTTAVPVCPFHIFMRGKDGECSPLSQVGIGKAMIRDHSGEFGGSSPIVKLPPPPDAPARFGYRTAGGDTVLITPRLRSDGDYGLRLRVDNLFTNFGLFQSVSTLWGVPWDPIHDPDRFIPLPEQQNRTVFLTNPTYCDSGPLPRTISARSWKWQLWTSVTLFGPAAPNGCEKLVFGGVKAPVSLTLQPDQKRAASPSGLEAQLRLPYNDDPYGLARPALRETTVQLPEGVTVNPSAANGLAACTEEQIGLKSLELPSCPDASRMATVKVTTPLLAEPLDGTMYLAEQDRNPYNSTMAMYLHVAGQGIQVKVPGRVDRDERTGQITTTFQESPQLPFTEMDIRFKSGDRAPLVTPTVCGRFASTSTLKPWSHPYTGPPVTYTDPFAISEAPDGGACVSDPNQRGFRPTLAAGTENPVAGKHSPFVVRFTRGDSEQEFDRIELTVPKGLTGKLKGIPYCAEAQIAQAIGRDDSGDGARERANPSCPAASRVGSTQIGVGAGPSLYYASGDVYLAGPYKGAPLSLAFIVPAVAGPFDLGVQVVRTALRVDPVSAQITAASDEIPKILEGVPLRVRDIRVIMDRPEFTLNPTNCSEQRVAGTITGSGGASAPVSSRFQVGDCAALPFRPRLQLQLHGKTRRAAYQRLVATVTARPGDANIGRTAVTLPHSAFLAQEHIRTVCTRVQWAADACPKAAIYGRAEAITPLLDEPLKGNVYLRSSPNPLPDLAVDLRGPAHQPIKVELVGRTDSKNRGIRNTFEVVPDAPVTKFRLEMFGGEKSLIVNSRNLCKGVQRATVRMQGQNGKRHDFRPVVGNDCGKKSKGAKKSKRSAGGKSR